jgi:hypothetical protein
MDIIGGIIIIGCQNLQHHNAAFRVDGMCDSGGNAHAGAGVIEREEFD